MAKKAALSQDVALHLDHVSFRSELAQLVALRRDQPLALALVDVGVGHPVAKTALADR
jgi:hypothetical protein